MFYPLLDKYWDHVPAYLHICSTAIVRVHHLDWQHVPGSGLACPPICHLVGIVVTVAGRHPICPLVGVVAAAADGRQSVADVY
ncbi:MAG: hypothetical protein ABW168_07840 [Sedimenticola sp.]